MNDTTLIFETFLTSPLYKTYQYVAEYMERVLHIPAVLLNGEGLDDFAEGHADAGFISANAYLHLMSDSPAPVELIATPLQLGKHEQDSIPTFFDIIVHRESEFTSLNDLEHATWAYHVKTAQREDQFRHEQDTLPIHFHKMIETPSLAQSIRSVLDHEVDASAIEGHMLEFAMRNRPRIAEQLRVIGTYSSVACPLVVLASHLEPLLKYKIREALLCMHHDHFFAQRLLEGQIERFLSISSTHSQQSRRSIGCSKSLHMQFPTRQRSISIS